MGINLVQQPQLFAATDGPIAALVMLRTGEPTESRYIRTSWMLSARSVLEFEDSSQIRFFSAAEAATLAAQIQKHNVFARHTREANFYVERAKLLADRTVIEVFRPGPPKAIRTEAADVATDLERLAVLSSGIAMPKTTLLSALGIGASSRIETTLVLGPRFYSLMASAQPRSLPRGILMDKPFSARFVRCGFHALVNGIVSESDMSRRLRRSLAWLFDSRIDPRLPAAAVKTSIALESLLILHQSESLSQSLSERAAFVASQDAQRRELISRIIKRFYDARSATVHGRGAEARKLTPNLLEAIDRLAILLCLVVANNSSLWPTAEALQKWCEGQRWGAPTGDVRIPFRDLYLRNALALAEESHG